MRRLCLAVLSASALLLALVAPAAAIDAYQGRKRAVVVFAPSAEHPMLARQRNALNANRVSLSDRDVVFVYVVGTGLSVELGSNPGVSAATLRSRYRVSEGQFRVFMFEKDGTMRLESATPVTQQEITAILDRAPLKRETLRPKTL